MVVNILTTSSNWVIVTSIYLLMLEQTFSKYLVSIRTSEKKHSNFRFLLMTKLHSTKGWHSLNLYCWIAQNFIVAFIFVVCSNELTWFVIITQFNFKVINSINLQ